MTLQDEIFEIGKGFSEISDFSELIEKIKDKKVVMLGESSHGTQEFYEWRRLLSNELLSNHDFNFIAVEGDWPACERINQYIHGDSSKNAAQVMTGFSRWPTWIWGNTEVTDLMDDLREINNNAGKEIGYHGMDVYSLYESLDETIKKLHSIDPVLAANARELYSCFDPFRYDERAYAHSLFRISQGCKEEVASVLSQILKKNHKNDQFFDVIQNARIIKNAERYYRAMITYDEDAWNVRDQHMLETLDNLLEHFGQKTKAIIWAPMFSTGSLSSISLAMVTPSLQTMGFAHFLPMSTLFDFGTRVIRMASVSIVAPWRSFICASDLNNSSLDIHYPLD
jgi:erythromycin esterase-like protein